MNSKIKTLLKQAAIQERSSAPEKSSVAQASRSFSSVEEADQIFQRLKERLTQIDRWNHKSAVSNFELYDSSGGVRHGGSAVANNFIKITLPGSGKYDWVRIIEIYDLPDERVLTVQPAPDPTAEAAAENTTSHFFTSDSTNSFCLEKKAAELNFYVIGLSEIPNTADTQNILESVRNFATAKLGRYFGIQLVEWKTFCENFLETESEQ